MVVMMTIMTMITTTTAAINDDDDCTMKNTELKSFLYHTSATVGGSAVRHDPRGVTLHKQQHGLGGPSGHTLHWQLRRFLPAPHLWRHTMAGMLLHATRRVYLVKLFLGLFLCSTHRTLCSFPICANLLLHFI